MECINAQSIDLGFCNDFSEYTKLRKGSDNESTSSISTDGTDSSDTQREKKDY